MSIAASNMLDVPNFFWDSEPTLHPLYYAVREYLEIKPRIQVLNERCRVFLDLAEILSDSIADNKMSRKYLPVKAHLRFRVDGTDRSKVLTIALKVSHGSSSSSFASPSLSPAQRCSSASASYPLAARETMYLRLVSCLTATLRSHQICSAK